MMYPPPGLRAKQIGDRGTRTSRREWLAAAGFCSAVPTFLRAQDEAVFKADVRVVNVLATVRSKTGDVVKDLAKDDFVILENGREQNIRYFAAETDLPLTLGLMVDTSMSQEKVLNAERGASYRFFDQILRDNKDRVFVMQFDMAVMLRQALTASRRKLEESLAYVDTPTRKELMMQTSGGTLLYDAVLKACQDVTVKLKDRKALIILSDGVDTGSEASVYDAIDAALRTDTLIYSILFEDGGAYFGHHTDGRAILARLARETGGGYFEVSKKRSIDQIYEVLEVELRSQYNLGFVSDQPVRVSEFRKLEVKAKRKAMVVQARERYWAQR
jgi:VWFA-related protein